MKFVLVSDRGVKKCSYLKSSQNENYFLFLFEDLKWMERIFAKSTLRAYWEKHPDTEQYLKTWYDTAMNADWKRPSDVKQTYASASILKEGRVVFNIKGNSHRLIVKINFEKQWLFIRFIGTHLEYDKIDANRI
jgi:mRNA interferase HigB